MYKVQLTHGIMDEKFATMNGAIESGIRAASEVLNSLKDKPQRSGGLFYKDNGSQKDKVMNKKIT